MTDRGFAAFDTYGHPLNVGTRVKLWNDEKNQGVIDGIGDFDVDEDRICYPDVMVRFDNADGTESFGTWQRGKGIGYNASGWPDVECEELESMVHEYVDHVDSRGGEVSVCKHCGQEE